MHIQFKGTNYELSDEITDIASKKLQALTKYLGKTGSEPMAYVDLGKRTEAQANGDIWYGDCNLDVEGKRYYAKATAETLRTAIDRMVGELAKELRRDHKKQHSLLKRGGFRVKEFFRFGT
jgi:ribosomal subunit interface protein